MTEREFMQLESEPLNVKALLVKYLRNWYWFVLAVVLCFNAAFVYLRYTTPQYRVSSTLLIKDDKKGPGMPDMAAFSDLDVFKSSNSIDNEIEVLKSRSLMQRVLTELSLQTSYYAEGRVKTSELYGAEAPLRLIVSKLDSAAFEKEISLHLKENNSFELEDEAGKAVYKLGQEIRKPYGIFTVVASKEVADAKTLKVKFHDIRRLAEAYNRELQIMPVNKNASVITLSLVDAVPAKGVAIINKLVEVYNREAVEDKNQVSSNTIQFIDDRLKFLTSELAVVEKDVEAYKRTNRIADVGSEARLFLEQASENNKQLAEWAIQIEILESIEKYIKEQKNEYELVPSALNIQDMTLLSLIAKFNELQMERQRILRSTQPNNPLVQNLNEQLANLRVNLKENLKNIKNGLTITRSNLLATSAKFDSKIEQVPARERELLEINRQQGIKQALYLYLLQKREEAALSLGATVSNSRVIDPAVAEDIPVSPKKQLIYLLALLLGVGFPVALLYVKELLNDKVQQEKDVKDVTAIPVLGELYNNETGQTVVVTKGNRSPLAELFRLIRTNMQFSTVGKENKVILVTSSMSGEGKTFFSINLGATLSLTGKKVVILGFDLRKPRLLQDLQLPEGTGISNYLISDKLAIEDILTPVPAVPDLFVIGSGPIPPNPAELMMSAKVGHFISELKERFDHVIIDSPPVGQVADSFILNPYIDSSIYVVRYNYTYKTQLALVNDIYVNKKLNHPMLVLNDAKKENTAYGYGYGYGHEEKKGNALGKRKPVTL